MSSLLLEEQDKVSLDDDLRIYRPEISDYGRIITIRHLIHHTSGIRDYMEASAPAGTLRRNWPDGLLRALPATPRTSTLTPASGVELSASVMVPVSVPVWAATGRENMANRTNAPSVLKQSLLGIEWPFDSSLSGGKDGRAPDAIV